MISIFLGLSSLMFLADATAVFRLRQSDTREQILDFLNPNAGHPGAGTFYCTLGIGLILTARHETHPLCYGLYVIGAWISFLGVRFFEAGFMYRFFVRFFLDISTVKRCVIGSTETLLGLYLAFLSYWIMLY